MAIPDTVFNIIMSTYADEDVIWDLKKPSTTTWYLGVSYKREAAPDQPLWRVHKVMEVNGDLSMRVGLLDNKSILDDRATLDYGPSMPIETSGFTDTTDYHFDGVNDYINIPNHASIHSATNFTVFGWILPVGGSSSYPISKSGLSGFRSWYMLLNSISTITFGGSGTGSALISVTTTDALSTSVKSSFALVVDLTSGTKTAKIYINGIEKASVTLTISSIFNANVPINIGRNYAYGTYFEGSLDEPTYWKDKSLSSTQILDLHNAGVAIDSTTIETASVGFAIRSEDTESNVSNDRSANTNHGTLENGVTIS